MRPQGLFDGALYTLDFASDGNYTTTRRGC